MSALPSPGRLRHRARRFTRTATAVVMLAALGVVVARAQLGPLPQTPPPSRNEPVFYQADHAATDRERGLVTLSGHVEIWQGQRVLRADRVTYDRNTGVAAASGHVALVEPGGEVLFADYAELSDAMKDGILRHLGALLPQNGRLAANGARRTNGTITEMSGAIYTTCNLCAADPNAPPLWDIRARSALQDAEHKKIEYQNAWVDFLGVPVAYFPFLVHPDPTARRASGLLVPQMGYSSHLGAYASIPYYWAINGQSDATLQPILSSKQGGGLQLAYRQALNNGRITLRGSVANDNGELGGHVFTRGDFVINDTWRWGFDINRASGVDYMRDWRIPNGLVPVLGSSVWLEGFGAGAYARLDVRAYQNIINGNFLIARLPYVLPHYQYRYFGEPDALGGRLQVATGFFNLERERGTNTQRARLSLDWQRPATGAWGERWTLTLHLDSAVYSATSFNEAPNFGAHDTTQTAQAMPTAALKVNWPLVRDAGTWGSQVLEPIAQVIVAPNGSTYAHTRVPNEDSLDQELSDANLFALNRFAGVDRLEGGVRVNAGVRAAWLFPSGAHIDGLVGESYRPHKSSPWLPGSGLDRRFSDVVSRLSFTPNALFDLTARARFDPHAQMKVTEADLQGSAGPQALRLSAGFIHSAINPFFTYDYPLAQMFWGAAGSELPTAQEPYAAPRDEVTLGASTRYGRWRLSGSAQANVRTHQMTVAGLSAAYENECAIFNLNFYRRYTSIGGDHGDTVVLFEITLKTVGEFGFHPM
jgi:LPS-assembly protein